MALLTAAVAACSHASTPPAAAPNSPAALSPCPSPEPLRLHLRASARLNLSERGEPLATVVRVYQLKGTGKISVASFDDLLDHDKDALGEDFVAMQELTVNPGVTLDPPLVRSPEATHVAVVALFRRPASTTWRTIEKLPPPDPQYCHPAAADKDKEKDKDKKSPPPKDPTLHVQLDESRITTTPSS